MKKKKNYVEKDFNSTYPPCLYYADCSWHRFTKKKVKQEHTHKIRVIKERRDNILDYLSGIKL